MILRYYGHAFFTLTLENGTTIAMDPYDELYQYPRRRIAADVVTMSHHHYDHDGIAAITAENRSIDTAGVHAIHPKGVTITGIPTFHDHHQGAHRGNNLFFVVEAEGLRIGHAGDLGHLPTDEQLKAIGKLDILLLPVGGKYTVDAKEALQVMQMIQPTVCIPMHYRTQYNPEMQVTTLEDFLQIANCDATTMPLMRATAGDMSERTPVVVLEIQNA